VSQHDGSTDAATEGCGAILRQGIEGTKREHVERGASDKRGVHAGQVGKSGAIERSLGS
jgi:hypothetical protein